MLPVNARIRHVLMEERMVKLAEYGETFPFNKIEPGERSLGIIANGISYQYAREVFPNATFLKLGMTYPLPEKLIREFAAQVDRILVVEELDPFIEDHIKAMGIKVEAKIHSPLRRTEHRYYRSRRTENGHYQNPAPENLNLPAELAKRPPLLCPGCPAYRLFLCAGRYRATTEAARRQR